MWILFTLPFLWGMEIFLLVSTSVCFYCIRSFAGLVGLKIKPLRISMGARTGNKATVYDTTLIKMVVECNYHLSQWYTGEDFREFLGHGLLQSWEQRWWCLCLFSFEYSRNMWMWTLQLYSQGDASEWRRTRQSCQSENSEAAVHLDFQTVEHTSSKNSSQHPCKKTCLISSHLVKFEKEELLPFCLY